MNSNELAEVQGAEVQYAFHTLGWYQFQELCAAVLSDVLGQTFQTFEPGNDAGRDGAFIGSWRPHGAEMHTGTFTFQVKYTRTLGKALTASLLKEDIAKANALQKAGLADHYYILTNCAVTFEREQSLKKELKAQIGCKSVTIFGPHWLTQKIRSRPSLRAMVPRVYGLGDLSEIIDHRAYAQARAVMDSLGTSLSTFVPTAAYWRALNTLDKGRFVFIVGDAMTGKTTLAYQLALRALDHKAARFLKLRDAESLERHLNVTTGGAQFIWVDDAFGETQHDPALTASWSRHVDLLHAAMNRGAQIIFTSRSYIWRAAQDAIKRYSFLGFDQNQVVIELADLTEIEKRQMLYHHVRMGKQPEQFKLRIRNYLAGLAKLSTFLPEAARRLGNPMFTSGLETDPAGLKHFFEKPLTILSDVLRGLDPSSKAALGLLFAHGGSLPESYALELADRNTAERFGAAPESVFPALEALRDSLVKTDTDIETGMRDWAFAHPSIRDAFADLTAGTATWLGIYLAGADVEHIIREVHCGRLQAETGARIVVPVGAYKALIARLEAYVRGGAGAGANRDALQSFLATRCSEQFLRLVLAEAPLLLEPSPFGFYYSAVDDPWLGLCERLLEMSLLSKHLRDTAIERMQEYAETDLSFLESDALRDLFTPAEYAELQGRLQYRLRERLADQIQLCVRDCEAMMAHYPGRITSRILDRFRPVIDYCEQLTLELEVDHADLLEMIEEARQDLIEAEATLTGDNESEPEEYTPAVERSPDDFGGHRDFFRDVADDPRLGGADEPIFDEGDQDDFEDAGPVFDDQRDVIVGDED